MEQATNLFNAIYSRFLLRDLFGKIVPGIAVLFGLLHYFGYPFDLRVAKDISFWTWLILIGFAWLLGFAIQSLGEWVPGYRYYPKWKDKSKKEKFDRESWYSFHFVDFLKKASEKEEQAIERLVVIKEACGNGYVAGIVLIIIHCLSVGRPSLDKTTITLAITSFALLLMHRRHVKRQFELTQVFIKHR